MTRRALGNGSLERRKTADGKYVWVGTWKDADGNRRRKNLSTDKRVAQRLMAELVHRRDMVRAGLEQEENIDRPIGEVFTAFLEDLRARRSPRYARRVSDILARLQRELRFRTLRDVKPQVLMNYRAMRIKQGAANRTANMEVRILGTALGWAVRANMLPHNPVAQVPLLPTGRAYEKRPRRAMSEEEVERFVAAVVQIDEERRARALAEKTIATGLKGWAFAAKQRLRPIPQEPLWIALLETGARFGELTRTTWADLSETNAALTLRAVTTKSRRERVIPLRRELLELLRALRVAQHDRLGRIPGPGDRIFVTVQGRPWNESRSYLAKRFREILDRAGIPRFDARREKLDVHALRHTAASRMARSGVGLVLAQKILGHSDPRLTAAVYSHLEVQDLREAVERVPGLKVAREG